MVHVTTLLRDGHKSLDSSPSGITVAAFTTTLNTAAKHSIPKSRVLSVPHVTQTQTWDCGLACLLMVLRAVGNLSQDLDSLHKLCPTQSVWTVDLAHLLRRFGLQVSFTTLTIGTNPGFSEESFYGKMHVDEIRVQQLFEAAAAAGIEMQQRSVPARELQELLLSGRYLVIALVDKSKLEQGLRHSCPMEGYKGHYVVLCGYDSQTDQFLLRDPDPHSGSAGLSSVTSATLDRARHAFGTDEDLLLIQLPTFQGIMCADEPLLDREG